MNIKKAIGLCLGIGMVMLFGTSAMAATYSAGVVSPIDNIARMPIAVIPDESEEVSINGYIIRLTYDDELVTPIVSNTADVLGEDCYATLGDEVFDEGIFVSDLVTENDCESQLVVAWATASPVVVSEKTILATVDFKVAEGTIGTTVIGVQLMQLTVDGESLVDDEKLTSITVNGEIRIYIENGGLVRGDADNDDEVTASDATTILRHVANIELITDDFLKEKADADADGGITASDATTVLRDVANIEEISN